MEETQPLRIITVAYNPGPELEAFCASIPAAISQPYELVIADNGTEAAIVDEVARRYDAAVMRTGANLGYGAAVNRAASGYEGEWFFVANPDITLEAGCIDGLLRETRDWPRGGAFGPRIYTPSGEVYPSARRFPTLVIGAGHALLGNVWPDNPFSKVYRGANKPGHARRTDWLSGSCLLLRRAAFDEVGGFDEGYFMFFEDTQLGRDLLAHGWRSVYVPRAQAYHDQGKSWRDQPEDMIRAHHDSAARYVAKEYSRPWHMPVRLGLSRALRLRQDIELQGKA